MGLGCQPQIRPSNKREAAGSSSSLTTAAGRQPRGNKLPEVVPELDYTFECQWCLPPPNKVPRLLQTDETKVMSLANLAKLPSYIPSGEAPDETAQRWMM